MESLMKADIFFFITAVAVVVLTVFVAIALYYIIQILANFRKISDIMRGGAENVEESIKEVSENLANNPFIKMFFSRKTAKKKRERNKSK